MKLNFLKYALLFVAVLSFGFVSAQQISGTISDENGPLPGATVLVKGTTNGTFADFDGNYTIEAASGDVLVFSYVGYNSKEVTVGSADTINVVLEASNALEEVVVVGYGTQQRGSITGSVASVDVSEATKTPMTNAAEALQGRVSGVTVVSNNSPGSAPKIVIRGFGTSNNTDPLYVIDGVQTDDASVLNSINPNDIEQMNVLKDGAAAIYGARASNGVVIITTKSGGYNMAKARLSVDAYTGYSEATRVPQLLSAPQHGQMIWDSMKNDGLTPTHPQYGSGSSPVVPSTLNGFRRIATYSPLTFEYPTARVNPNGTDWFKEATQVAATQNFSFTLENGNAKGKYLISSSFNNREGILKTTFFKQGTTRLNSEFKVSDKITIGEHVTASFSNANNTNVTDLLLRASPLIPVYTEDGGYAGSAAGQLSNVNNPVADLYRNADNYNKTFRMLGDVYMNVDLGDVLEGLSAKTRLSGMIQYFNGRYFTSRLPEAIEPRTGNTLTEVDWARNSWTWTNSLNYNQTFGDHNINAILGVEAVDEFRKGKSVSRTGYLFEDPNFYLLSNGGGGILIGDAYAGGSSLYSLFGTTQYSFGNKYYLTATVRQDTSSRFKGDNKTDIFPSFSGGWVLSEEDFFNNEGAISRMKVKASWGQIGNQTLPANNPTINISSLNEVYANYSLDGSSLSQGAMLSQVGNPNLRWETSEALNYGVELGFLDNALTLDLDIFNIETKDLVTPDNSLISTTAIDAGAPLVNLGNVKNSGFDLALGYNSDSSKEFVFGIQGNVSAYKNEVTQLISAFQSGRNTRVGSLTRTEVGQPISSFYGLNVTGLDSNGRFVYEDVNGDGSISALDRTFIGSPHPDFTYGLNLTATYKNFDFSAFFQGAKGNDVYNYEKIYTDFPFFKDGNRSTRVLDAWTPSNTNTNIPALSYSITNNEADPNSYFVEDASYLKLKNLQIGYTMPDSVVESIGASSLRIYLQGTNLLTITDYTGVDPEVAINDNLSLGIDENVFPMARILTFGVNLKL